MNKTLKMTRATGRQAQKLRTRQALLDAARDMMASKEPITVGAVAERAGISVATAYRYFSDPETIRLEAVMELGLGQAGKFMTDLEHACKGVQSVLTRLKAAQSLMLDFVIENEDAYRLFLAKGHENVVAKRGKVPPEPRGGRRVPMIEFALEPWRMDLTGRQFQEATQTIAVVCGPDSYFVLRDLYKLPENEIRNICADTLGRVIQSLADEMGVSAENT